MSIVSLEFAGFVLIVLAVYYALPRHPQNVLLLIASYLFYATWSLEFPFILALVTLVNFVLARRIERESGAARQRWLQLGLGFNLIVLGYFKYADFFVPDALSRISGLGVDSASLRILLPVGMSFYIFQAISYLVDVSRKQLAAETDWVDFAVYMAYFPKMVAGPTERARGFLPKLRAPRVVDNERLASSLTLIVVGVVRKIVLADSLAALVPDDYFTQPDAYDTVRLLAYALGYTFWLYNDFAGYTNVARGVSGLFGIELSQNFQQPYFSRNLTEFWNRWHITLSHWLRDYIFYPVSRALIRRNPSRNNPWNILLPPMLTMLVSGLWHGTGWHMVFWGALHGVYLVFERVLSLWIPAGPPQKQPRWRQGLAMGIVFVLVVAAWVPFSMTLPDTWDFFQGVFAFDGPQDFPIRILIVILVSIGIDWVQYRPADDRVFLRWPRLAQAALLALALLAIFLATQATTSPPFVYQGF